MVHYVCQKEQNILLIKRANLKGEKIMDYNKAALEMHESHKGKIEVVSKVQVTFLGQFPFFPL